VAEHPAACRRRRDGVVATCDNVVGWWRPVGGWTVVVHGRCGEGEERQTDYMTGWGMVNIAIKQLGGCIVLAYSVIAWGSFVRDSRTVASPCR